MRIASTLAVLALFFLSHDARAQTLVKIGVAQSSIGTLPLEVAERNGFFAAEGIAIETYNFRGGAPTVQALASRSIDICVCAGDHAVRLRSRGLPAKIIAGLTERHGYALLALSASDIMNLADLRGGTVGITSPGSLTDNSIRYAIAEIGMNPDRDVTLASIGVGIAMRAAVDGGSVDAGMFTTPDVQAAIADAGKYRIVHDFRDLQYTALVLIALEAWLGNNAETARAFLRAVGRAQDLLHDDGEALREALRDMYPALNAPTVEQLAGDVPESLASGGIVSEEGYRTMISMLSATEPELKKVPFTDVVSAAYLPAR